MLPAVFILVLVGGLIGSWMIGGTIPMLVYYGLKIISPEYLLLTSFLVTCRTGTSWGSAGTVGVALMGVAAGMDANLAAVAVVSGAYFGDKNLRPCLTVQTSHLWLPEPIFTHTFNTCCGLHCLHSC